jgi:hypothetical protein
LPARKGVGPAHRGGEQGRVFDLAGERDRNPLKASSPNPQALKTIRTDVAGRQFGFLTTQYRCGARPHRISCRCVCERLIHVAREDLVGGLVTSCGCRPPSPAFRTHQAELRQQLKREILFREAQL